MTSSKTSPLLHIQLLDLIETSGSKEHIKQQNNMWDWEYIFSFYNNVLQNRATAP